MEKKEKKGFFSSLFASNNKGCSCGLQIEEVPVNESTDKQVSDKQDEKKEGDNSGQQTNQVNRGCGC